MFDITIHAGANYQLTFYMRDANNGLQDLTGMDIQAQLRPFAESSKCITFDVESNGAGGVCQLTLTPDVTERIDFDKGVYDVMMTDSDGVRKKVLWGMAKIVPAVTRPVPQSPYYVRLEIIKNTAALPSVGLEDRIYYCYTDGSIWLWHNSMWERQIPPGEIIRVEGVRLIMPAGMIGVN